MTYKLLAIAAMSLSLGSAGALAQTTGTTTGTGATTGAATGTMTGMHDRMPMEWEGNIGDAFYADTEMGLLRDEEEMRAGWDDLDDDDREAVRDYCERFMEDDQAMMDAGTVGATGTTDTTATTGTAGATGTTGATTETGVGAEAADPLAGAHQASLRQICEMIDDDNNG